tara:strand:- start:288 stop:602 length:315 start_codon:yes stop_codon:yes gene_type:complete
MSNLHLAVTNTHKDIVTVYGNDGNTATGFDISGNEIDINATLVSTEQSRLDKIEVIQTAIRKLESQETPRRLAEALPDDAGGSADGRAWLKANRDKIILERDKL